MINIEEETRRRMFAIEAAMAFTRHPTMYSYTRGEIKEGQLLAIKWGMDMDCVLVLTIGDEPTVYEQMMTIEEIEEKPDEP